MCLNNCVIIDVVLREVLVIRWEKRGDIVSEWCRVGSLVLSFFIRFGVCTNCYC